MKFQFQMGFNFRFMNVYDFRLAMNSPLEHDFDEYNYHNLTTFEEDDTPKDPSEFGLYFKNCIFFALKN